MVQTNPQPQVDPLAVWRKSVEEKQGKIRELESEVRDLKTQLAQSTATSGGLETEVKDHAQTRALLRRLASHVAGRNGMLERSRRFCGVCQNAASCPLGEVTQLIGEV